MSQKDRTLEAANCTEHHPLAQRRGRRFLSEMLEIIHSGGYAPIRLLIDRSKYIKVPFWFLDGDRSRFESEITSAFFGHPDALYMFDSTVLYGAFTQSAFCGTTRAPTHYLQYVVEKYTGEAFLVS